MTLSDIVGRTIQQYHMLQAEDSVVVGLSGGADSVCLLRVLRELRSRGVFNGQIRAVHVHHGLRKAADADEQFVRRLCADWNVPLSVHHVDVAAFAREHGMGEEEAGHVVRADLFAQERQNLLEERSCGCGKACGQAASGDVKIALAHHLEDRAETQIFNLVRGSSLAGMAGILPVSGNVIRPLIGVTRPQIEEDLHQHGIAWRTDESNTDISYSRNRIRHRILPELEELNDQALAHCAAAADTAMETERYLEIQTQKAAARCCVPASADGRGQTLPDPASSAGASADAADGSPGHGSWPARREQFPAHTGMENGSPEHTCARQTLRISTLMKEDPLIRRRVLYQMITACCGRRKDIEAVHVEALLHLCTRPGNGSLTLPYGITAVREYDLLILARVQAGGAGGMSPEAFCFPWPLRKEDYQMKVFPYGHDAACIPRNEYTKWFDYDKISVPVEFRTRRPGDRIGIGADGRGKPLARCMIDAKIPRQVRDRMILPAAGSEILWLPGSRIHAAFRVDSSTRNILELHLVQGRGEDSAPEYSAAAGAAQRVAGGDRQ